MKTKAPVPIAQRGAEEKRVVQVREPSKSRQVVNDFFAATASQFVSSLSLFPVINQLIIIALLMMGLYLLKAQAPTIELADYAYYINHGAWVVMSTQLLKGSSKSLAVPLLVLAFGFWGAFLMPMFIEHLAAPTHLLHYAKILGILGLCLSGLIMG